MAARRDPAQRLNCVLFTLDGCWRFPRRLVSGSLSKSMKKLIPTIVLPLLCAGCLTAEDMMALSNPGGMGGVPMRPQPGMNPTYANQNFNQAVYADGYRRGYRAGFNDSSNGMPYRAAVNYNANPVLASGFTKGYQEGFYEGRRGMPFGCSL